MPNHTKRVVAEARDSHLQAHYNRLPTSVSRHWLPLSRLPTTTYTFARQTGVLCRVYDRKRMKTVLPLTFRAGEWALPVQEQGAERAMTLPPHKAIPEAE